MVDDADSMLYGKISVIRSCRSISSLCFESNNTNLLLRLLTDVLGTSTLLRLPNIVCPTEWRRVLGDHGYRIYRRHCTLFIAIIIVIASFSLLELMSLLMLPTHLYQTVL